MLNYNDSHRVIELVDKLESYSCLDKIVIVDNDSDNNQIQLLKSHSFSDKVKVIRSSKNIGFASGHNLGFKELENEGVKYVFVINSDVIVSEDALEDSIDAMEKDKNLGLVSPLMLDKKGKIDKLSGWNYPTFGQCVQYCFWIGRRFNYTNSVINSDTLSMKKINCDCVRGSLQCFRFDALKQAGYYDQHTFLYYEENIISKRIKKIGYSVAIITSSNYIHNHLAGARINTGRFKMSLNSMNYYLKTYCDMTPYQEKILKVSEKIGILEHRLIDKALKIS